MFPFVRGWIFPKKPTDIEIIREIESVTIKGDLVEETDLETGQKPLTLEEQLMETLKVAQMRANSSEVPLNSFKWSHRGNPEISVPEKIVPILRAEGTTRLRTLTTSSNEFVVPDMERDGVMEEITLKSNSKVFSDDKDRDQQSKPKKGIMGRTGTLKRIGQTFKLFNLRTGKMEKFSGFAFSQESGAGRTISTEEHNAVREPEPALLK